MARSRNNVHCISCSDEPLDDVLEMPDHLLDRLHRLSGVGELVRRRASPDRQQEDGCCALKNDRSRVRTGRAPSERKGDRALTCGRKKSVWHLPCVFLNRSS